MYEAFFGLQASPFSMTPDPAALFWTPSHREALAGLTYAIARRKGFVVLTGAAGAGKTTLLRKLLDSSPIPLQTSFIYNPTLTPTEFLELALSDFDMPQGPQNKAQRLLRFEEFLLETHRAGQATVLIIDEAHKLSPELLEEIRLLTNFETTQQKLLQIVLAGQPELSSILNQESLWQLKQRVAVRLNIRPLLNTEISQYIAVRWAKAGGASAPPFEDAAIAMLAAVSQGIPRVINGVCDNALLLAYSAGRRQVLLSDIIEASRDLDLSARVLESWTGPVAPPAPAPSLGDEQLLSNGSVPTPEPGLLRPSFRTFEQYQPQPSLLARWAERCGLRVRRPGMAR